jgi:superfamily II DNA helicase RecQ
MIFLRQLSNALRYHGDQTHEEKEANFKKWIVGECCILVSTTRCGTGIDLPGLWLLINVGALYDAMTWIQNIERVSRDGRHGVTYLFTQEQPDLHASDR